MFAKARLAPCGSHCFWIRQVSAATYCKYSTTVLYCSTTGSYCTTTVFNQKKKLRLTVKRNPPGRKPNAFALLREEGQYYCRTKLSERLLFYFKLDIFLTGRSLRSYPVQAGAGLARWWLDGWMVESESRLWSCDGSHQIAIMHDWHNRRG